MVFTSLDTFGAPESVRIHADDALHLLDLFGCHREKMAIPRSMKAAIIIAKAIGSGFIEKKRSR